jgi:uncharacterized protein
MASHNSIDYLEFPATDLSAIKEFYGSVFGWSFTDYGPEYASFAKAEAGRDGGFATATEVKAPGLLAVLYSENLEQTKADIEAAGGKIVQDIFSFPGGRRFHFTDPSGNELAIWGEDKG